MLVFAAGPFKQVHGRYQLLSGLAAVADTGFELTWELPDGRTGTVTGDRDHVTVTYGTATWTKTTDGCVTRGGLTASMTATFLCPFLPPGVGHRKLPLLKKVDAVVTGGPLTITSTGPDRWEVHADGPVTNLYGLPVPEVKDLHMTVTFADGVYVIDVSATARWGELTAHVTVTALDHRI